MMFLNQTPILVWFPAFKIIVIAAAIIFIILGTIGVIKDSGVFGCLSIMFFILALFMAIIADASKIPSGRYKYEVILNEGYDIEQLQENYVVTGQRGLIYEIEDKTG